jgi:hypothetical protein
VNSARSVPAANENEQANEKVKQRRDAQIILDGGGIFLGRGDERCLKSAAVATQLIANFHPGSDAEENPGDIGGAVDGETADRLDDIALLNSGFGGGRVFYDMPGGDALRGVHPGHAVVGKNEAGALLKIEDGKNDRCQG